MRARESGAIIRGQFYLVERLSHSQRGEVWFAENAEDNSIVVLRLFPGRTASAEEQMAALSQLGSPHLPRLLTWGADGEDTFIVTARVGGEDLSKYLARSGPVPPELLLTIVEHAALGLDALHALGFLHGDVKPQNIMLEGSVPPRAVLIDIEGAALHGLGTPLYMAPERFGPHRARDPRSDLYALGVTAFELATGRPPFYSDRVSELGALHSAAPRPRISDFDPSLAPALSELIGRLIRVDPRERYQTARGLAADADGLRTALRRRLPWSGIRSADLVRADTPLVGREGEWRRLVQLLQGALERREAAIALIGPAGIGKTRLMSRLRSLAEGRGVEVRYFSCAGASATGSLAPFRRLLAAWTERVQRSGPVDRALAVGKLFDAARGVLYRVTRVFPALAPLVASATGAVRPHEDQRDLSMFLEAVARLVILAMGEGPSALLLDGLDGADGATIEVLRRIPRLAQGRQLLLAVAGRKISWAEDAGLAVLPLGPLDHAVATELCLACGGAELGLEAASELAKVSGGNPGLIEELVRLRSAGATRVVGDRLEVLVESHLEGLPSGTRDVLRAAAALGDGVEVPRLAHAVGRSEEEVAAELQRGAALSVLRGSEDGVFVFPFPQVRAKLRDALPPEEQRVLHRRALEWLIRESRAEEQPRAAATHALGAEDAEAISRWLPLATEEAARAFDLTAADELYAECVRRGVLDRVAATLSRAQVLVFAGRYGEGRELLRELEATASVDERPAILEQRARIAFRSNDINAATESLEGALEAAGERLHHDPLRLALSGAWRFVTAILRGGPRARGKDATLAHKVRLYEALIPLYFWHQPSKMLPSHLRQLELAERLGTDRERSSVYMHHAHLCQFARLSGRARRFVEEADRIRSSSPDPWDRAVARFERGTLAHRRGEWRSAEDDLRSAAQEILALGDPYQAQIALGSLCLNCIQLGTLDEFDWAANLAHDLAVASGDLRGEAWGLGWRSYGLILRGRPRDALEALERAEELSRRVGDRTSELLIDRMRGEALLAASDFDAAVKVLETASEAIRRLSLRIDFLDGVVVVLADALTHRHLAGVEGATLRGLRRVVARSSAAGRRYPVWAATAARVEARLQALSGDVPGAVRELEALAKRCDRASERIGEIAAYAEIQRLTGAWRAEALARLPAPAAGVVLELAGAESAQTALQATMTGGGPEPIPAGVLPAGR